MVNIYRERKFEMKNIPNVLSVIRILLVFVFVVVFFSPLNKLWALIVFLTAGATDVVDGFLARRNNWITDLGKVLDPFADKLMQCTVLVCLCIEKVVPIWFLVIYFAKELLTLLLGFIAIRRRSVVVVSKWYGKASVCLFYATIFAAVIIRYVAALVLNDFWQIMLFGPAAIFSVFAFGAYIGFYSELSKDKIEHGKLKDVIKNSRKAQK